MANKSSSPKRSASARRPAAPAPPARKPSGASGPASRPGRTTARDTRPMPRPAPRSPRRPGLLSPATIVAVAVVMVALAGFAIYYNQRAAAPAPVTARPAGPSVDASGVPIGVTEEGYPYKGNPDAKVVIENFSDYQCPFCAEFAVNVEPRIDDEFVRTGRVKMVFRDFQFLDRNRDGSPNPTGESHRAALAAHCAKDQGQFWAMHDVLYARQGKKENAGTFSDENLETWAGEAGLNMDQFRACMKSNAATVNRLIDLSMNDTKGKQVRGTPTLFVNDRKLDGGDYATLKAAIELAEQSQ